MIDFGLLPTFSLALAISVLSGLNVYGVFVMLGLGALAGFIDIPSSLDFTTYPLVVTLAILLFIVEFFVDKIPFLDTAWDAPHTFIRIILGGFLASKVLGGIDPSLVVIGAILGSFIASTSHAIKSGTRVVANASPEPASNILLSLLEDALVLGGIFLAIKFPLLFCIIFCAYILLAIWLFPKIWRVLKKLFYAIAHFFGFEKEENTVENTKEPQNSESHIDIQGTLLDKESVKS